MEPISSPGTANRQYTAEILARLHGARFFVAGFEPAEAGKVCNVLNSTGAIGIPGVYENWSPEAYDGLILRVSPGFDGGGKSLSGTPTLVALSREDLAAGAAGGYAWATELLMVPFSPVEVILRAYRMLIAKDLRLLSGCDPGRASVIVADDDPAIATIFKSILACHMDCRIAKDGTAALQMIRQAPPSLLLLDVNMPGMNGFEVLETIRREPGLKSLPVILLTGEDGVDQIQRGKSLGADDYIVKPFGANTIMQRIRRALLLRKAVSNHVVQ